MGKFLQFLLFGLALTLIPWLVTQEYYANYIYPSQVIATSPTALVFGAGLGSKNRPSAVLAERIMMAVKLYQQGKVKKILLSGDGLSESHNEPAAMRELALKLGVPATALILDYAGNDTYNSCLNAKYIFNIEKAILVTQRFHLPRALFICNNLGVSSVGVDLMQQKKSKKIMFYRTVREVLATFAACVEVWGNRLK